MSEAHMRRRVVRWLKPLNAIPVENPAQPGTPDVNYVEGWIELKKLNNWPKGADTIVKVDHFTPQQRAWLKFRRLKHGRAFLLLQVKNEWLLFEGRKAAELLGLVPRHRLEAEALRHWRKGLQPDELRDILVS